VKNFAVTIAVLLCLTRSGLAGDDSKNTTGNTAAVAPIQAVAMPRVGNNNSSSTSSSPQKSAPPQPVITIIQPAAAPSPAVKLAPVNPVIAAVQEAAQPKFDDLVDQAANAKSAYGFKNDDNLNDAQMGEPMPVYTVSPQDAAAFTEGQNIDSVLKQSGHWLVPVSVGGALRTFIQVSETSSNTFEVGRASVITARVWNTITTRWPAEKNFHPKLVMYPSMPSYFFTVPELQPQNLTDLDQILSEMDRPATLSPASVTFRSWR
jgi:hypothetical protein